MHFHSPERFFAALTVLALTSLALILAASSVQAQEDAPVDRLNEWRFLIGSWSLLEQRFSFEGELIQENEGRASFSWTLHETRIQEMQELAHGEETTHALLTYVYNPRREEIEIARTDSGHYGFSVTVGSLSPDRLVLREKHPNPNHQVIRRYTFAKESADRFVRTLEFSTDQGENWFDRSVTTYSRLRE